MVRRPLFWQLFPSYALVVLLSVAAATWFLIFSFKDFYLNQTRRELEVRALLVKAQLAGMDIERDADRVDSLCKQLSRLTATRITVVLADGTVIGDSDEDPSQMENHANRPEIGEALGGRFGLATRYSHTLFRNMMYAAIPLAIDSRVVGAVRTALPVTTVEHAFGSMSTHVLIGILLIAALAAIASLLISRRIARPLRRMTKAAEAFSDGDFASRLPAGGPSEIDQLAQTMNTMAVQLDEKIRTISDQKSEREAILSSMVEGVIAVDNSERIISVNQAAATMLSVREPEVRGRYVQEALRIADLQRFIVGIFRAGGPQEEQFTLHGHPELILYAHGAPLQAADGRSLGAVIVLHDVTRLHQLEAIRRDFVANVSHELRTPITSIKGFVETLRDSSPSGPDAARFLDIIARQSDRLNSIVEDLLTLSELEQTERGRLGVEPTNLKELLDGAADICASKARERNVTLAVHCDSSITQPINPSLMEQAVVNLVDNAIKYSAAGGTVEISAQATPTRVTISVVDHGCGIERIHLPRLFERFYRVDRARSREMGGTGLGLSIVKHIVSVHGGSVAVESSPGRGSSFTISIPRSASTSNV